MTLFGWTYVPNIIDLVFCVSMFILASNCGFWSVFPEVNTIRDKLSFCCSQFTVVAFSVRNLLALFVVLVTLTSYIFFFVVFFAQKLYAAQMISAYLLSS